MKNRLIQQISSYSLHLETTIWIHVNYIFAAEYASMPVDRMLEKMKELQLVEPEESIYDSLKKQILSCVNDMIHSYPLSYWLLWHSYWLLCTPIHSYSLLWCAYARLWTPIFFFLQAWGHLQFKWIIQGSPLMIFGNNFTKKWSNKGKICW